VVSTIIDRIIINTPFFGMFFYYSQWAFLTIFVLGFVAALFKRPRNNVDDETDEHLDADEEQALLDDARRRQRYGGADQFRDNHSPNPVLASTAEPNSS
jgi:LMBR1 domain-containing protein 1